VLYSTFEGHLYRVNTVAFSPDGQLLVSVSDNNTVRLWDSRTGALCNTLESHSDRIKAVAFSLDGLLFASASDNKTLRL
jgi:WD40 repeat protein